MAHDSAPKDHPPSTTSRLKKVLKGLFWLGAAALALLICAGLLLTYWFPSDLVRQELEVRLSALLQGAVRIHSLSFNLLTGLRVSQLEFTKPHQPPLTLEHLTFDYSLLGVLKGNFTINEISIERAKVSLNLPELTKTAEPPPPPPSEPGTLPTIPVSIDLETLKILDSDIQVVISRELTMGLTHVQLQSSGGVSSEEAHLKGSLQVEQLALALQNKHIQGPLIVRFDIGVHLQQEQLDLKHLIIESDSAIRLTLSGTIDKFWTQKIVNLSLVDTYLDLGLIRSLAKDFVPPEFASASIQGNLSPSLTLTGSLPDSGFQGIINLGLDGKDVMLRLPDLALSFGPTNLSFTSKDLQVNENLPARGNISGQLSVRNLGYQAYGIQNLDFRLNSEFQASGPFSGNLNISGTAVLPGELLGTPFNLPIAIALDTRGNHQTRHIQLKNLNVDLNPYGKVMIKGALTPHPASKPGMDASLQVRLSSRLNALLSLIPKDQLQGLVLQKGAEADTLVLQATGTLHPDFRPEWGKATAALKLSPVRAKWETGGVEGTLHQLTFLLASNYQEKSGLFQGTVGFSSNLSGVRASDGITLGTTHMVLKSSFQGNLSRDYQLTGLRSQDQLQITLENMTYQEPSLTTTIPSLKLSAKTKEDVFRKDFLLESLRLTSEKLLEVGVNGRFRQATQQFDVDIQIPLLHVGNLLPHLSGSLMKGIDEINPKGQVSLALRAAGKIPQKTDLNTLALPLGLNGKLTLRDLEGAVAGYRIQQGNGTISVAYSPQATPQTQLRTDVKIDRIHLPDTHPLSELSDTALHINMVSPDLNEIQLDPIHVTSKGMDLFLKGAIVGLREFWSSTSPRGTQLAKLFAHLQTRLGLDIGTFEQALAPLGVKGKGKVLANVSLLKQEQGSFDASMAIGTETLSLTRESTELKDMNGSIQFRKTMSWKPDGLASPQKKNFQPSDRIAELKSFSKKGQTITIDRLQVGPFTVRNLSTNLAFEQQALKLQNFAMNLLGGGIGGNVIIAAEKPLRISAGLEVANLDANQLITTESKIRGDSRVAATIGLTTILQDTTGAVDLSRLECHLHITHIGKEALNRFLVFLDPEGRNPTLSNARAQLQLANPSRVTLEVTRGLLNLSIQFQGSLIPTFRLERVPIAKMKSIEKLTAAIPNWENLAELLKIIEAETYSFTPEGDIVFQ